MLESRSYGKKTVLSVGAPFPDLSSDSSRLLQVKTEEQIAAERAWFGTEKVWLVHKEGFSLGKQTSWVLKIEVGA